MLNRIVLKESYLFFINRTSRIGLIHSRISKKNLFLPKTNNMPTKRALNDSIRLKQDIANDSELLSQVDLLAHQMTESLKKGGKIYFCGNGGSAADAQHLSAELSGRYYYDRPPLASEALHVNSSYITAVANDYGYDMVFARLIEAFGRTHDMLIGLSTSGNSQNVIKAFEAAKKQNIYTVAFTGETGGKMTDIVDLIIKIPSTDTPRIQEAHMLIGHSVCEIVEQQMFPRS